MDALSQLLNDINMHGAVFRQVRLAAPWGMRLSTRGLSSFHLCQQGGGWLQLGNEAPRRFQAGDGLIVPKGTPHRIRSGETEAQQEKDLMEFFDAPGFEVQWLDRDGPVTTLLSGYFHFDVDLARPIMEALPDVILLPGTNGQPAAWLQFGLQFLLTELRGNDAGLQMVVNRAADIILVQALRQYLRDLNEDSGTWLLALKDRALSSALVAMHGAPQRDWTVPELARLGALSRSAFVNRFKKIMGRPPLTYLREHRMRLAAWRLQHTRQPVWQIAEQLGYGSDVALTQAFKRTYGCTPTQHRQAGLVPASG